MPERDVQPDAGDLDRSGLKDHLWAQGVSDDRAEELIARWEAAAASRGLERDAAYWRLAADWIDRERGAS